MLKIMTYLVFLYDSGVNPDIIKLIVKYNVADVVPLDEVEQILEIATNEHLIYDILEVIRKGNDFIIFDSVEELGEDNSDNGCREDDDTDESFGEFLLRSYKDGNSINTIYYKLNNGKVLVASIQ